MVADATASGQIEAAIEQAAQRFSSDGQSLDGIANCFGSLLLKPAHATSDAEFESVLAVNLKSAFATVRGAARSMKGPGSVVFVSSAAARLGLVNHEAIAAAKAGVQGLALAAAASYARRGLRFNCVAPGLTATPLTARITGNEASAKASLGMHALGRFGQPEEVAAAIEFLLDPANSWITGQVLGWRWRPGLGVDQGQLTYSEFNPGVDISRQCSAWAWSHAGPAPAPRSRPTRRRSCRATCLRRRRSVPR